MPAAIAQRGVVCHMTYRPANNPIIDGRIQAIRNTYGAKLQSAKGSSGGIGIYRGLMRGESVALMNDQKYNEGLPAPFFGHDCMTADGPTRMALRYGVPLIPFSLRRLSEDGRPVVRFRIKVHDEIPLRREAPVAEAAQDAVIKINAFMEARVREAPEQWFWVHKRWPKEAWTKAGV
jgi:KDO2-lipid IV(A) lauroyltransferase